MFEVNDIPPIDGCELQELIGENVRHEEFLFFRINHGDDLDWILGEAEDYECFCTACQQHFAEDRKKGALRIALLGLLRGLRNEAHRLLRLPF